MKKIVPVVNKMRILFLDIETAPNLVYSWGLWRQNIAINQIVSPSRVLSWAAKWLGDKKVSFDSAEGGNDSQMLVGIWNLLNQADAVVTYNGKSFDIPKLNTEFKRIGLQPPSPYHQIDLYRVVRSNFDLPSNKLEYVAKYFGLGKKVKTEGMELWIGCMNDDRESWRKMRKYNIGDVKLTERLYMDIRGWIKNHPNHGLYTGDELSCPNCGSVNVQKRGVTVTSTSIYQRFQCQEAGCGKWSRSKRNVTKEMYETDNPGSLRG